jgi:hypothetical protein
MYTLALILASGVTHLGSFDSIKECNTQVLLLREQEVKAICVKQPSPEEAMRQMAPLFQAMQKMLAQ